MSQNPSSLPPSQNTIEMATVGTKNPVFSYQEIDDQIQADVVKSFAKARLSVPRRAVFFTSKRIRGGRVVAGLSVQRPNGESVSYAGPHGVYASIEEAKSAIYQEAYNMGVLDFIRSGSPSAHGLPLTPPPAAAPGPTPAISSSSSSPTSNVELLAPTMLPPDFNGLLAPGLDVQGNSSTCSPIDSTQPPTTPRNSSLALNSLIQVRPNLATLAPETDTPGLPGVKASAGPIGLVSSTIGRLAAGVRWPASSPQETKRTRSDDAMVLASGSAQGPDFEEPPNENHKIMHGVSYRSVLEDYCRELALDQLLIGYKRHTDDLGTGNRVMYRFMATVGSRRFELPEMCDSITLGEERLSKHILEALSIEPTSD